MNITLKKGYEPWMSGEWLKKNIPVTREPYASELVEEVDRIHAAEVKRLGNRARARNKILVPTLNGKYAEVIVREHTNLVSCIPENVIKYCQLHRKYKTLLKNCMWHDLIDPGTGLVIEIKAFTVCDTRINQQYKDRLADARKKDWFVADRFITFLRFGIGPSTDERTYDRYRVEEIRNI